VILAELVGYAANSDAFHTNAPPEDGRGVRRVMELALQSAGLRPSDIQYLNAHATSTPLGDLAEARAIVDTFGVGYLMGELNQVKIMSWLCPPTFRGEYDV
jgi:3-oxoacyl-[acyl-carrier-protein] synthase II